MSDLIDKAKGQLDHLKGERPLNASEALVLEALTAGDISRKAFRRLRDRHKLGKVGPQDEDALLRDLAREIEAEHRRR